MPSQEIKTTKWFVGQFTAGTLVWADQESLMTVGWGIACNVKTAILQNFMLKMLTNDYLSGPTYPVDMA